LRDGLAESFDAELGGVIHRVAGEGDLAAVAGQLNDAAAAGFPHVRQHRPDELNAGGQVGGEDGFDLGVGKFFGRAEDAVAGVADRDVDPAEGGNGAFHHVAQPRGVADVEHLDPKQVRVPVTEVGDRLRSAHRADDAITSAEQLFGQMAAEAAADPGD
jgi:hypothetical protein